METLKDICQLYDGAVVYLHENNIRYIGKCTIIYSDQNYYLIDLEFKNNKVYRYLDYNDNLDMRFFDTDDLSLNNFEKRYLDTSNVELFDCRANLAKEKGILSAYSIKKNEIIKYTRWIDEMRKVFVDPDLIKSRSALDALIYNSEISKNLLFSIQYLIKIYRNRCAEIHSEINLMLKIDKAG